MVRRLSRRSQCVDLRILNRSNLDERAIPRPPLMSDCGSSRGKIIRIVILKTADIFLEQFSIFL